MTTPTEAPLSRLDAALVYQELGVVPVVNACGIYTDLGGSCLSDTVWKAASEVNRTWASMPELLDSTGRAIADLIGAEAARVVPGASAALALSVGACMAGQDGAIMEQLPVTTGMRTALVMQAGHRYKYTRCALMSGARLSEVGRPFNDDGFAATTAAELEQALGAHVACVLHPAHLDGKEGTLPLAEVVKIAHGAGVPVVVDAAYMSYPTDLIASYGRLGADITCFSAKYFWGPNAGGFVYGRRDLLDAVAALDFTGFESGPYRIFGRAFKMDRATVVATTLALQEWMAMDHAARWSGYQRRAEAITLELQHRVSGKFETGCFTLDERLVAEPVNSVFVTPPQQSVGAALALEKSLASGTPSIRAVAMGDLVALCLETVFEEQDQLLVDRTVAALAGSAPQRTGSAENGRP